MNADAHTVDAAVYARRWKTLAVLSLSLVIIGLDNTILNVALPSLREHFDASNSTLQWIVDSYLLVFAGLLLTMGTLGDRFGRKRALLAGLAIFGTASLAVLAADSANHLIAIRAAMGVGAALIMPATLSIITNVFPREERGKAIGIWAGMAAIGIGLGPLFGGLLLEWFSWTSVFLVNVPVTAVAVLAGVALVPESRDPHPGRFDLVGAGISIAALVALVYGVIEAPERGWTSPVILGCFATAAVLVTAFVRWELRTAEPMLNLSFFRNPRFSVASAAISVAFFSLFGSVFALTQYLQDAKGYSALQAGAAMVPLALGLVMGAGSSIKLVARLGTTRVVTLGLVGLAALFATSLAWEPEMAYWPLGLWFFGLALSMGWIMGPATDSVMGAVPEEKAGVASAMNDVARQVAGALGVAVIGSLVGSLYAARVEDATDGLPADQAAAASDSVGAAVAIAERLPEGAGSALHHAATNGYTDALGIGLVVAAAVALAGAAIVARLLPAHHRPAEASHAAPVPSATLVEAAGTRSA
jgi:EmrB/QacA subfamily drug resistance transporter